jgi:hypothetical protein
MAQWSVEVKNFMAWKFEQKNQLSPHTTHKEAKQGMLFSILFFANEERNEIANPTK